jgi:hypothetical protein
VTNKWLAVPRRAEEPSAEAKPQVREPESEAAADAPDQPVAAKANEVVAAKPDEALEDAPDEAVADASDEAVAAKPHESATAEGAAEFDPAPNGRRSDEVPAPDPLSSQPERGA